MVTTSLIQEAFLLDDVASVTSHTGKGRLRGWSIVYGNYRNSNRDEQGVIRRKPLKEYRTG